MNDKCACGTGATIDKCFLKVNAPPELVTQLHFDDSKLHHVAAKCGVFAETDIVNLIKSGIPVERGALLAGRRHRPAEPLGADARRHAQAPRAAARRAQHLPAVPPGVLAPAHPADLGRARLRVPEGRAHRGDSSSSPRTRSTTRRSARCSTACTRPRASATSRASSGCASTSPRAARRASARRAGPPLAKTRRASSTDFKTTLRHPQVRAGDVRAGRGGARRHRPGRRLDLEQGGARRLRERAHPLQGLPALQGQPHPGHQGAAQAAPRLRRGGPEGQARGHGLRRHRLRGRRARGVRAQRREHRRDGRAHDERRALLRRRRRHLRHRRAGHQGPVHEERRHRQLPPVEQLLGRQRHAAPGHGRLVRRARSRSSPTSPSRPSSRPSSPTAARCSSTPTA